MKIDCGNEFVTDIHRRPSTQLPKPSPSTGRDGAFPPTSPVEEKLADAVAADTYSPGYLGPGSYALLLPQDDGTEVLQASVSSEAPEHELTHQHPLKKEWRREVVTSILSAFRHYAAIQELILWYNASNEAGVIPAQLQIDAINAIGPFVDKHDLRRSPPSTQLVDQIMENSRKPLCVTKVTHPRPPSWRRINDLATQIYALGMHKESTTQDVPTWLIETRRRVFCSSYNQDKAISTFLGRPIRISKRHTDMPLPRDLRDDELTGSSGDLDLAIRALDANGWNTRSQHLRASWIRLRHISSRLREEILDFSLLPIDSAAESALKSISSRIRSEWESLPAHMRYWKTCWDESYPSSVCLMLVVIHLTHWYNEFMIQKLLDYTPLTSNAGMLRVSVDLLSNVLALGAMRDRTYDVHRDLLHCILLYGIPSASVLATALRQQQQSSQPFPQGISRSEIVRMLSVLISHLDASAHLENSGARAGEANYNLCRKASKIFTRVIDQVLDPKPSEATPTNSDGLDLGIEGEMGLDLFGVPGLEGLGFEGEFGGFVAPNAVGIEGGGMGVGVDWGALGQWTL
ncbi:hypothetical protein N0V87_008577 [Didymella glomerata]|uniref:Xylanolytic transcriptional activator regulatory domain-containing protein n=1 Tax=Didymella glomerata TaxID=749621 RepID=A0A9W8WSZ8_9PLEO|nr:hypothetical protein N0V87_008577 [Didymella glomerata]